MGVPGLSPRINSCLVPIASHNHQSLRHPQFQPQSLTDTMELLSKARASELIRQLEEQHAAQIKIMKELYGLPLTDEAAEATPQRPQHGIPEIWRTNWDNQKLKEAIESRSQDPLCGGGLRRCSSPLSLPHVIAIDGASYQGYPKSPKMIQQRHTSSIHVAVTFRCLPLNASPTRSSA